MRAREEAMIDAAPATAAAAAAAATATASRPSHASASSSSLSNGRSAGAADIVSILSATSQLRPEQQLQQQQQARLPGGFRYSAVPLPVFVVLLSPWMDLEAQGASHRTNADTDYIKVGCCKCVCVFRLLRLHATPFPLSPSHL